MLGFLKQTILNLSKKICLRQNVKYHEFVVNVLWNSFLYSTFSQEPEEANLDSTEC